MDMLRQELEQILAFLVVQLVDLLGKNAVNEQRLPSRYWVDPDDRVRSLEILVIVEWRATVTSEWFAFSFGSRNEEITTVFGGETFEEFAIGGCQSVVELVSRGPEGVYE